MSYAIMSNLDFSIQGKYLCALLLNIHPTKTMFANKFSTFSMALVYTLKFLFVCIENFQPRYSVLVLLIV